ncbi:Ig-like domain-containing protein, partial [Roseisolibacter sp. H3M3-2]|uniref:Ig-like domain-containing protein n=1 Tax=Roseisolibacter sp. H3M3-2 TaxID=3031323 RepID=UPI0023DC8CEE
MVPTATARPRPRAAARFLAFAALALAAACGGGGDGPPPVPSAVSQADVGVALAGPAGGDVTVPVRVRVTAEGGRAVGGTPVTWAPNDGGRATPTTSTTDADGVARTTWTLGPGAGVQTMVASAGTAPARTQLMATAAAGRAATLRVQGDTVVGMVPGLTLQLRALVADRFGNPLDAAAVSWTSADDAVVAVDASGRLIARAPGATTVAATSDTARARLTVRVSSQAPLAVTRVAPDTLVPGGEVVVEGSGFVAGTGGGTELLVSGVRATLVELTPTRIRATVPATSALPCQATGAGTLTIRRDLGTGTVDSVRNAVAVPVAARRTLRVGENLTLLTADAARCTQLEGGSRYLVTVFNVEESGDRFAFGQLRGAPASAVPSATPCSRSARVPAPRAALQPLSDAARLAAARESAAEAAHGERLSWVRELARRAGSRLPGLRAA